MARVKDTAQGFINVAAARARRAAVRGLALLLGVGAALALVLAVGRATRDQLRHDDRFRLPFAAVECQPAPPLPPPQFLAEVQYLAELPDQIYLLEDNLAHRLAEAFARHPWVARVERVTVGPSRQVQVRLAYRTPVLAVMLDGRKRAVDRDGVLLPAKADVNGLPVFPGKASPPAGPAGTRWGDAAVEQAARTAGWGTP